MSTKFSELSSRAPDSEARLSKLSSQQIIFNSVILKARRMTTTLTSKGQVTIPKRIRDAMQLVPGAAVEFSVNAAGEVVLHRSR